MRGASIQCEFFSYLLSCRSLLQLILDQMLGALLEILELLTNADDAKAFAFVLTGLFEAILDDEARHEVGFSRSSSAVRALVASRFQQREKHARRLHVEGHLRNISNQGPPAMGTTRQKASETNMMPMKIQTSVMVPPVR